MCQVRLFHIHAPATGKVRRPTVESHAMQQPCTIILINDGCIQLDHYTSLKNVAKNPTPNANTRDVKCYF